MKLVLLRKYYTDKSTIGELSINGHFECHTLEDKVRSKKGKKVYGQTAIPAGTYQVIINTSSRFNVLMPLLLNVPGYEGIRIHPGNTDAQTLGCLLVGMYNTNAPDFLSHSKDAYNKLYPKLKKALDANERITIEIIDTKPAK
jgi:hypothetical protein